MIIQCESCKAKFRLNEDKITGKGVRVRCKNCGGHIIVMKPGLEHMKVQFMNGIEAKGLTDRREDASEKKEIPPQEDREGERGDMKAQVDPSEEKEEISGEQPAGDELDKGREEIIEVKKDEEPPAAEEGVSEETRPAMEVESSPGSGEGDQEEEAGEATDEDEVNLAFEQFLDSIKEESGLGEDFATDLKDKSDKEGESPEDIRDDSKEEGEKFDILSSAETLKLLSAESEQGQGGIKEDGAFDLSLEDEKLELTGSQDISDSVSPTPDFSALSTDSSQEKDRVLEDMEFKFEDPSSDFPPPDLSAMEEPVQADSREKSGPAESAKESVSPYEYVPRAPSVKKRRSGGLRFLSILLGLLVLIAGGGAYLAFTKSGNQILVKYAPQVRSLFGLSDEVTKKEFTISNLIGYYEMNDKKGKIFIIKGEVVNLSKSVKSGIVLKGELLGKKGEVLSDKKVYAGNSLDAKTLKRGSKKSIEELLQNKLGKNLSNIDIQPGSAVPFMIVFFDLPGEIEAYKVENIE